MISHGDNCRHCHGKMSAPKPVLDGPRMGQSKRFCTKCGHIEYDRSPAPGSAHAHAAVEHEHSDYISPTRGHVEYTRAVTSHTPQTHAAAREALARSDYATAIDEYRKVIEFNPDDALAYSEISRAACEHLGDPGVAAATLEEALCREWPQEDAALLCMRLVDVYWHFQRDAASSRALLVQLKEAMPGTQYAADAQKRLHEINEQIALQRRQ